MEAEVEEKFTPRNYQIQLMNKVLEGNTIIYLPTGSGKTFIALMSLKHMSEPLSRSYSSGGKISVLLVNTVALVDQHAKYFEYHTTFKIGRYTGEMNLDFWPREKWYDEYDKYNVLIMTSQVFCNLVMNHYIDLNKVNLLIFDECHHGVNDHPMRQIMINFDGIRDPPRVLGLTATLLNGNCSPAKVIEEVKSLETTYHAKVATVDGLEEIIGYSTNPKETLKMFKAHPLSELEEECKGLLASAQNVVEAIRLDNKPEKILPFKRLNENTVDLKNLKNLILDCITQIETFGLYGGYISMISSIIQIKRVQKSCIEIEISQILSYIVTVLSYTMEKFDATLNKVTGKDKVLKHSSDKVLLLLSVLDEFKRVSKEPLCGIIFVQRRTTAKIVHHILKHMSEVDSDFQIRSDFMVGLQNNPYSCSREGLFIAKKNKEVLDSFIRKEINIICASNVLEEGVDIPKCTLVIKFDEPSNYRSYIQSKGRARHKSSMYYILLDAALSNKYLIRFSEFQQVESNLNKYLIGKNEERSGPTETDLINMYTEAELPPYFVSGPNSACVNMLSAIPLLCRYCQNLPGDHYTDYAPDWYIQKNPKDSKFKVYILLPTVCPLLDLIEGSWMLNSKNAKRAAALKACILLHKMGELDDHLLPKEHEIREEDVQYLFTQYPKIKESNAGTAAKKRLHKKQIPNCLKSPLKTDVDQTLYLHIIDLQPTFQRQEDINKATMYDVYTSSSCFGVLSPKRFPILCSFPTYVALGTVNVNIKVNAGKVVLSPTDIEDIKEFHFLIFNDVLEIVKPFLAFDTSNDPEMLLVVPVDKNLSTVDFKVLRQHYTIKPTYSDLSNDEKLTLEVTQETYLKKIVSPTYRSGTTYIVTEVSYNRNPTSSFPNMTYGNFMDYYKDKHSLNIVNKAQPLLLVKALSKRLNLINPRGQLTNRKRKFEDLFEYLIPELLIKQDFPGDLWVQASFLPTILTRIVFLLQVEEIRSKIALEANLGKVTVNVCKPLRLDEYLLNYDANIEKEPPPAKIQISELNSLADMKDCIVSKIYNKDFSAKKTESEYPWKNIDEPKDIMRDLTITQMDIEHYENFVSVEVTPEDRTIKNKMAVLKNNYPALTYDQGFTEAKIRFLHIPFNNQGPEQCDVYKALTTVKANDIVNLERLETLGDSFLKLISTLYIALKFPNFNEGQSTSLKGRLVSNKNLFYLAEKKKLGGIMRYSTLSPREEWVPPAYAPPQKVQAQILKKQKSVSLLFDINIPAEEQVSGFLSKATLKDIEDIEDKDDDPEELESCMHSTCHFLKHQYIGDKNVSDVVESLLGLYFETAGFTGAVKLVEWFGIIPKSEKLMEMIQQPPKSPLLGPTLDMNKFSFMFPQWREIQKQIGYTFNNLGYLLQAMTHGSYTLNRLTRSYETLEFLGDAVLDFLITCHIYDSCGFLDPGQLTDLRSALVNNNTFASFVVRLGFHKSLLMMNAQLQTQIDKFVAYLESKNYIIDDEVIILLDEDDMQLAEYVDVPKILGDIFEALAGAIYLDSNKDLNTVWRVFHKIMYKEIDMFSKNVPKNVIRRLYETPGLYPQFSDSIPASTNKTMVALEYMLQGRKNRVFGFGTNKAMAKKAAAKIALRSLNL